MEKCYDCGCVDVVIYDDGLGEPPEISCANCNMTVEFDASEDNPCEVWDKHMKKLKEK